MNITVSTDAQALGVAAAKFIAAKLNESIKENGETRLLLSTGASQFETLNALLKEDVDWSCVTMFHLDEYVGLSDEHPASFRKYLKERFINFIQLKGVCLINGEADVDAEIERLTKELRKVPIDVGVIGIGENAHVAFNDPPAKFDTDEAYIIAYLDEACKKQQVGEGWFATIDDVPKTAISMTAPEIMKCKCIVSSVPHKVKAQAIKNVLTSEKTDNMIPATILKEHGDWHLFIDENSASMLESRQ